MSEIYRQGDVILEKVDGLPGDVLLVGKELAIKGETGQSHVLEAKVYSSPFTEVLEEYVEVGSGGALMVHPEHPSLLIPAGNYLVKKIRTFTPERIRDVID